MHLLLELKMFYNKPKFTDSMVEHYTHLPWLKGQVSADQAR